MSDTPILTHIKPIETPLQQIHVLFTDCANIKDNGVYVYELKCKVPKEKQHRRQL